MTATLENLPDAHAETSPIREVELDGVDKMSTVLALDTPLERGRTFDTYNGPLNADLIARIASDDIPQTIELVRDEKDVMYAFKYDLDPRGERMLVSEQTVGSVNPDKKVVLNHNLKLGGETIGLEVAPKAQLVKISRYRTYASAISGYHGHNVIVQTAEQDNGFEPEKLFEMIDKQSGSDYNRLRRGMAKVGLGVLSALLPHGPVDMALDAGRNQPAIIQDVNREVQDEYAGEDSADVAVILEGYKEAADRIEITLGDLDRGENQAIKDRAERFFIEHKDSLLSKDAVNTFIEQISDAGTIEEFQAALEPFLTKYGVKLITDATGENIAPLKMGGLDLAKVYAKDIVHILSLFPVEDFKNVYDLNRVVLSDGLAVEGRNMPGMIGGFHSSDGGIYLNAGSGLLERITSWGGEIDDSFAHELTHGQNNLFFPMMYDKAGNILTLPLHFAAGLAGYDTRVGLYDSIGYADEYRAEVGSELLEEGITEPDNALTFESPVNKDKLRLLMDIESRVPGFTDYFINYTMLEPDTRSEGSPFGGFWRQALYFSLLAMVAKTAKPIPIKHARSR